MSAGVDADPITQQAADVVEDPIGDASVLAPSADAAQVRKALARVALEHGACIVDRWVERDGKSSATFLLSRAEGAAELDVALDEATGRVASIEGHRTVSADRPNCEE